MFLILTAYDSDPGELDKCNLSGLSGLVLTKENRSHRNMLGVQYQILGGFVNARSARHHMTSPLHLHLDKSAPAECFGNPNTAEKDEEVI